MNTSRSLDGSRIIDLIQPEDITRRELIFSALGAALLIACGDDDSDGEAESRTIETLFGESTVPAKPQRVVAAEGVTLGNMLALGVKPIATGVNVNSLPGYLQDQMQGIEDITTDGGIDIERALALGADLIISVGGEAEDPWNQESCELYAEALPTFCYEYGYTYAEQMRTNLTEVARVLGLEDKAESVLAGFDARIAALKAKVAQAGLDEKPVSVVRVQRDGAYSIRIGTSESILFRELGIPQPEGQRDPKEFSIRLSLENLAVLNQAHVVLVYIDDNSTITQSDLLNNDVWRTLTPVREQRIVFINSGVWNSVDILGALEILNDIEQKLLPLAGG